MHYDDDFSKDFLFAPRFPIANNNWKHRVAFFSKLVGEEPTEFRMRVLPPTAKFDGIHSTMTENQRKAAPRQNRTNPRDLEVSWSFNRNDFLRRASIPRLTSRPFGLRHNLVVLVLNQWLKDR
jgi:hypothetical protein